MRHNEDARVILVVKEDLIKQIKANKEKHQGEYATAVENYKKEAQEQLDEAAKRLAEGKYDLRLNLITPIDNSLEYDKLVTMFNWEIKNEVELSQGEFNEYVLDETNFARVSRASNTAYSAKFGK